MAKTSDRESCVYQGIAASPGVAVGKAHMLRDTTPVVEERTVPTADIEAEVERFQEALSQAKDEVAVLRETASQDLSEAEARIFDVQLMILEDPLLVERTVECIRAEQRNAAFLFLRHVAEVAERLENSGNPFFAERAIDLHDVKRRVLHNLYGGEHTFLPRRPAVLMGRELTPSEALQLDPERVLAFVTDMGGRTSHAAIMARARGIPAVVGARALSDQVHSGDVVAVDGITGRVTLHPTPSVLDRLRKRRRAFLRLQRQREKTAGGEASTADGARIQVLANMEVPEELPYILRRGADGVGLFRTEFFFMRHHRPPTEDEQEASYRGIVAALDPDQELVIRVLDIGGDKFASYLGLGKERNPYLGMRGIRYLLAHPDTFRTQLRALLRAGVNRSIGILLPMVHGVEEVQATRTIMDEVMAELNRDGVAHDTRPRLGVMIEVPSAMLMAEELAACADFMSIGSNDLIQYLLAIDRDHETLANLYQPLHPAVIRGLGRVVRAGRAAGVPVSLCGEMASEPQAIPLLLGLGIDRLSVSPYLLPEIKQVVRRLNLQDCRKLAEDALQLTTVAEVRNLVGTRLGSEYSDLERLRARGDNGGGA